MTDQRTQVPKPDDRPQITPSEAKALVRLISTNLDLSSSDDAYRAFRSLVQHAKKA